MKGSVRSVLNNYRLLFFCVAKGKNSTTQNSNLIKDVGGRKTIVCSVRILLSQSNTHANTHKQQRTIPALELQTLSTQLCAAAVCSAVSAGAAADG